MNAFQTLTPPKTTDETADETPSDTMDDMMDGDRQLTTDSDAIDGGMNDSDLGTPRDFGSRDESDYGSQEGSPAPEAAGI